MDHDDRVLSRVLSRREWLAVFGIAGTSVLLNGSSAARKISGPPEQLLPPCVGRLEQTEGPYFIDEKLNRSDIRADVSNGVVREGTPLRLEFRVSQIGSDKNCTPLAGALVDLWHCDALGVYSDVEDPRSNTVGQKFLRGFQATDANGSARFTTIYPGWYQGRAVHIHFKIRAKNPSGRDYDFTSQLYFDDALTDRVHSQAPYAKNEQRRRRRRNEDDFIFRDGGKQLTLSLAEAEGGGGGYKTTFEIGLQMS